MGQTSHATSTRRNPGSERRQEGSSRKEEEEADDSLGAYGGGKEP